MLTIVILRNIEQQARHEMLAQEVVVLVRTQAVVLTEENKNFYKKDFFLGNKKRNA